MAVRALDEEAAQDDLRRIVSFLRARTGHDFANYKRATVMRRVARRMQVARRESLASSRCISRRTPRRRRNSSGTS
jgi:two-component system, chemotaxis family, CheB/CheR fusion protein